MKVLVIDIGGTNVKILATGQTARRKFPSGRRLTPRKLVTAVKKVAADWKHDVVSIGYPGRVVADRPTTEPRNLGRGWVGFDFAKAFGQPVKVINDAAMQALGSYEGGTMLFLGLGTGLGSALIIRGHIVPMELGALSYRKGTVESHIGRWGLKRLGKKKWQKTVDRLVARFASALLLDDAVIGGGNAKKLTKAHPGCRLVSNANAFIGGFRMWESGKIRASYKPEWSHHDRPTRAEKERDHDRSHHGRSTRPTRRSALSQGVKSSISSATRS
jgi:polyphosphate glucokinase